MVKVGTYHTPEFADWVRSLGIDVDHTRRIVIDLEVGSVPIVYAELFGPDDLATGARVPPISKDEVKVITSSDSLLALTTADIPRIAQAVLKEIRSLDRARELSRWGEI